MRVIVMAKEPISGRVKTRLCPPCSPDQAAELATAALADTLEAAMASGADEVVMALDGTPGTWCPPGVRVIAQVEGSFDRRLTAAWQDAGGPAVQIGMDTPQVSATELDDAMSTLARPGTDAVFGRAFDGGWWIIGLHTAHPRMFDGLPMSVPETGDRQRQRLDELGLTVAELAMLTDVDDIDDAISVATEAPHTRFARALHAMGLPSRS